MKGYTAGKPVAQLESKKRTRHNFTLPPDVVDWLKSQEGKSASQVIVDLVRAAKNADT